jgi:hypothetical protein
MPNLSEADPLPPADCQTFKPIGIFGGVRNETGDYFLVETYGSSVLIKIIQNDKVTAFQISPNKMLDTVKDIKEALDSCCERTRSDYAIPT